MSSGNETIQVRAGYPAFLTLHVSLNDRDRRAKVPAGSVLYILYNTEIPAVPAAFALWPGQTALQSQSCCHGQTGPETDTDRRPRPAWGIAFRWEVWARSEASALALFSAFLHTPAMVTQFVFTDTVTLKEGEYIVHGRLRDIAKCFLCQECLMGCYNYVGH